MEGFIVKLERVEVHHCDKCLRVFTNNLELQEHIVRHELKEKLYHDRVLEHMSSARVLLKRVQIYQCGKCPRCFLHYVPLNEHQKEHSRKRKKIVHEDNSTLKPHECQECGLRFVEHSTLTTHLKVHKPFPHICHCGIGFYQSKDLATHKKLVHPLQLKVEFTEPKIKSEFALQPKKKQVKLEVKKKPKLQAKLVYPKLKSEKKSQIKTERCSYNKENSKFVKNQDGDYECSFCGQIYKDETQFFCHINSHTGRWPHVCDKCPYGSKTEAMLIVHKRNHEEGYNGITKCDVCNKNVKNKDSLVIHMLIHTGEKQFTCTLCPKSFTQPGALKSHLKRHMGIYDYECEHCKRRFVDKGALDLHSRTHSGLRPYSCKHCGKAFSDPSAFKRHKRIHSGLKPYRCRYCSKAFSDNSAWIVHTRRHEGYTSMYPCEICKKQLATNENLQNHLKHHLKNNKFECDYCGAVKHRKEYLVAHIRFTHLKAKKYRCGYCHNQFLYEHSLNVHVNSAHEWNDDLNCPMCGETFTTEVLLKDHIDQSLCKINKEYDRCQFSRCSVTSETIKQCSETRCQTCKKNHSSLSALKQHKCIMCCVCNRYFKTDLVMKRHFMRHFNKKEHECADCPKQFYEATELKKHRSERHGTVLCGHCGEKFNGKKELRNHIWNKHMLSMYCNVCLKRFYTEAELKQHKKHCKKKITCKFCKLKVVRSSIAAHLARHANEKFKCDRCSIIYDRKSNLLSHLRLYHRVGK